MLIQNDFRINRSICLESCGFDRSEPSRTRRSVHKAILGYAPSKFSHQDSCLDQSPHPSATFAMDAVQLDKAVFKFGLAPVPFELKTPGPDPCSSGIDRSASWLRPVRSKRAVACRVSRVCNAHHSSRNGNKLSIQLGPSSWLQKRSNSPESSLKFQDSSQ